MTPQASHTFRTITVSDVMHAGVISCPPETPFREVASLMSENTTHCVIVDGLARGLARG
jgi:CBS domain-containing protein